MISRVRTLVLLCLVLAGCNPPAETAPAPATNSAANNPPLRVLIIDDPSLAQVVERQWIAHSGGALKISQMTEDDLLTKPLRRLASDVVICRSALLGELATRDWIESLSESELALPAYQQREIFELVRLQETHWGEKAFAVPLGCPTPLLCFRKDVLERSGQKLPETWKAYRELASKLAARESLGDLAPEKDSPWFGACEPLGKGWAAETLLVRSAAYVRHRSQFSTFFDYRDMRPLIGGAPFVRALEELVDAAKLFPPDAIELDPAAVQRRWMDGQYATAITWPVPPQTVSTPPTDKKFPAGFGVLPGSLDVYNFRIDAWETRPSNAPPLVPLVGVAGRVGSVTRECRDRVQAMNLLLFLSGPELSDQISPASPATTLFRTTHVAHPEKWVDSHFDADAAKQYAETLQTSLVESTCMITLRIPGRQRYMTVLDDAVRAAVTGKKTPRDALTEVAGQWDEITNSIGRDAQRKAYALSLGLPP